MAATRWAVKLSTKEKVKKKKTKQPETTSVLRLICSTRRDYLQQQLDARFLKKKRSGVTSLPRFFVFFYSWSYFVFVSSCRVTSIQISQTRFQNNVVGEKPLTRTLNNNNTCFHANVKKARTVSQWDRFVCFLLLFNRNFTIPKAAAARYKGSLVTLLWSSQTAQWPHDSPINVVLKKVLPRAILLSFLCYWCIR